MSIRLEVKGLFVALAVAAFALSSAFASGRVLQRVARRESHQKPTGDALFEAPTPSSPDLIAGGRKLFLNNCAHCHGVDARGDEGPDLHQVQVSDRYIANIITRGIPHEMPSFAKKLKADDLTALTAYVRSLE